MPSILRLPIQFGLASAILFTLLSMLGFNSLFLIFSAVPLLYLGHTAPFTPLLIATAIASFVLLLFSPASSLFFITIISVPVLLICAHHLQRSGIIQSICDLCGYAIVAIAGIQFSMLDNGGIAGWLAKRLNAEEFSKLDPALAEQMLWLTSDGSFLLIGIVVWWSAMFLLIAYWLTDKLLKSQRVPFEFPHFNRSAANRLPTWLLIALIIAIAIGLMGPENIAFLGMTSFVIILLPYFFYGAIHTPLRGLLGTSLGWSLVISVILMILAWPALVIAAIGIFKHTHQLIHNNWSET